MTLLDYANEERLKNNILNIVRLLFKNGPHEINISQEEWDHIVNKMMEEWKDVDSTNETLEDKEKWAVLHAVAKKMKINPEEMLIRTKLMYFIAKGEIMRFQILEMRELLDEYERLLNK